MQICLFTALLRRGKFGFVGCRIEVYNVGGIAYNGLGTAVIFVGKASNIKTAGKKQTYDDPGDIDNQRIFTLPDITAAAVGAKAGGIVAVGFLQQYNGDKQSYYNQLYRY